MRRNRGCNGLDHVISRRGFTAGGMGAALALPALAASAPHADLRRGHKRILQIYLQGGVSQFESWDPKPGTDFGGPFRSIPTALPGVSFGELVPRTAKSADKLTVIRSMSTKDENHSSGVPRVQRGDPKNRA